MGVIFRALGMRFVIYTNDHDPPHIHVFCAGGEAIFRLLRGKTAQLHAARGFRPAQLRHAEDAITARRELIDQAWRDLHG